MTMHLSIRGTGCPVRKDPILCSDTGGGEVGRLRLASTSFRPFTALQFFPMTSPRRLQQKQACVSASLACPLLCSKIGGTIIGQRKNVFDLNTSYSYYGRREAQCMYSTNTGNSMRLSGLRIWHCHCSGLGCCYGLGSVPGPRTSMCCRHGKNQTSKPKKGQIPLFMCSKNGAKLTSFCV